MRKFHRYVPRADAPTPAQVITDAIIARLEAGTRPWVKPWIGTAMSRPLRHCGTPYRGMNTIWLAIMADVLGYTSPYWMTYRQAAALGAQVRKGQKSTIAVFYKAYGKAVRDDRTGEERLEGRRVLKSFPVFNACQIDGLPSRYHPVPVELPPADRKPERLAELEAFFAPIPADIRSGGDRAYYDRVLDYVQLPPVAAFHSYEHYAATKAHELAHWTGHESRLSRTFGKRFGDDDYATEELVVELASAIIGAELGVPVDHLDDHASYIASWLRTLKEDSRAILSIAARADEAASYLLTLAGRHPPSDAEDGIADERANDAQEADALLAA